MLCCLISIVVLTGNISYDHLLTEEWANGNLLYRASYLIAAVNIKVLIMFMGFSAMESNFIACGQSYCPAKKNEKGEIVPETYFNIKQIDMTAIATQRSWTENMTGWNC